MIYDFTLRIPNWSAKHNLKNIVYLLLAYIVIVYTKSTMNTNTLKEMTESCDNCMYSDL